MAELRFAHRYPSSTAAADEIHKAYLVEKPEQFLDGFLYISFGDNNLLNLIFDNSEVSSVYWPPPWLLSWEAGRSTYNNSRIAVLNSLGNFSSSDDLTFLSTDYGPISIKRRLRIDCDGNI